jgi:hypothetical protein
VELKSKEGKKRQIMRIEGAIRRRERQRNRRGNKKIREKGNEEKKEKKGNKKNRKKKTRVTDNQTMKFSSCPDP